MSFDLSKLSKLLKKDTPRPHTTAVIGVDVGSSSVKIVQIHDNKGVATLDTYGELQLGPYGDAEIGRTVRLRIDKLVEALLDIVREAGATADQVAYAISYSASFTTVITVPETDPEKFGTVIPLEARKYVPVPLSDVTLDWFPVSAHTEEKGTKVLLAAIHNESLNRYTTMLQGAQMVAVAQELELFSTIRTVVDQKDTTVAIIDCGAGSTRVSIVHKGVLGRTHNVALSAIDLTLAIAKQRGVDFSTAEEEKRVKGLGIVVDSPELEKSFVQILEKGFREIMAVLTLYEQEEGIPIDKVILSGGGALLRGLLPYTNDMLSRPTALANPFAKVAYPAFLEDTLKEAGPSFAVALGAALNGVQNV